MKFLDQKTNQEIDTSKYLVPYVDDSTGETVENRVTLNKLIREKWFRSEYPNAIIIPKIQVKVLGNSYHSVLARATIVNEGKAIARNFAIRSDSPETGFIRGTEAAINAAIDRAIINLGFVLPEEVGLQKSIETDTNEDCAVDNVKKTTSVQAITEAQQEIADIEKMIEDDFEVPSEDNLESTISSFNVNSPVKDILEKVSEADARSYSFASGKFQGKTVGEVYETTKDNKGYSKTLSWFASKFRKDNILVACCMKVNNEK